MFALVGEMDLSNCDDLDDALEKVDPAVEGQLILDVHGLTFLDSSGVKAIIRAADTRRDGLQIQGAQGSVARVLDILGISDHPKIDIT